MGLPISDLAGFIPIGLPLTGAVIFFITDCEEGRLKLTVKQLYCARPLIVTSVHMQYHNIIVKLSKSLVYLMGICCCEPVWLFLRS